MSDVSGTTRWFWWFTHRVGIGALHIRKRVCWHFFMCGIFFLGSHAGFATVGDFALLCTGNGEAFLGVLEDLRRAASQHIYSILFRSCPVRAILLQSRGLELCSVQLYLMVASEGFENLVSKTRQMLVNQTGICISSKPWAQNIPVNREFALSHMLRRVEWNGERRKRGRGSNRGHMFPSPPTHNPLMRWQLRCKLPWSADTHVGHAFPLVG